jgi:hypothetical protein
MTTLALALLPLLATARDPFAPDARLRSFEPPGSSALTTGGLVWSYHAGAGLPVFAIGDRGGQVLACSADHRLHLLSSFDSDPPTPVWTPVHYADAFPVVAASESDVYLHAQLRTYSVVSSVGVLRKFTSRSNAAEWRYDFPEQAWSTPAYDLSRDGRTIVSAFANDELAMTELRVHDPDTGEAIRTYLHPQYISPTLDLSPDGAVAAFAFFNGSGTVEVYEVATGVHLASLPGTIAGRQALSDGGAILATIDRTNGSPGVVRAYARGASGYQPILDVPMIVGIDTREVVVSDDGSTLAAGWWDMGSPSRAIVRAYDLSTATMTMEHVDPATSGDILPGSIAISADGSRIVVGQWGDGSGTYAELAVYSPTSTVPLRAHMAGGAVYAVDVSPDGKRYAAARTPGNRGFTEASLELYEFGGEDLVVRGTPSLGETITFELHGAPGARAALLRSFALAPTPIDLPGVGTLHLDRATLTRTPIGVVPPSGVAAHSMVVGAEPGMVGRTLWFQGLTSSPRVLTNDFVQLTILP